MSARVRLTATIGAAVAARRALGTHLVAAALDVQTKAATGHKRFGGDVGPAQALVSGSSLAYDGVNWREVAGVLGLSIESWPVGGSSPAEWEQLQRRSPRASTTFVGVSLYDLNEAWLCDFRANIVPFRQTLRDLWESGADVAFAKRLSTWYTLAWVRTILPTAGRSDRVIFGLRDKSKQPAWRFRRRRRRCDEAAAGRRLHVRRRSSATGRQGRLSAHAGLDA